jgi:hypothetical protein
VNTHTFAGTILAALLAVFTLASSAGAACAWLLWVEDWWLPTPVQDERPREWTLVQAEQSQRDCELNAEGKVKVLAKDRELRSKNIITNTYPGTPWTRGGEQMPSTITHFTRVVCFPDTVDPRGTKGSAR